MQIVVSGHDLTGAKVLQLFSSVFGALIAVALLGLIRSHRLLPQWGAPVPLPKPVWGPQFWCLPALGTLAGELWGAGTPTCASQVNRVALAGLSGLLLSAALSRRASSPGRRGPVRPSPPAGAAEDRAQSRG